jgi:hypothetical protein
MDEIAAKLMTLVADHGPRSVAVYMGTGSLPYPATMPVVRSWLRGVGSPMFFTPGAIDQPGKSIAMALHGSWQAGEQTFEDADTYLLVGMNPVISKCHGTLGQNPGRKIKNALGRGMKMIVIDPRRKSIRRCAATRNIRSCWFPAARTIASTQLAALCPCSPACEPIIHCSCTPTIWPRSALQAAKASKSSRPTTRSGVLRKLTAPCEVALSQ